MNGRLIIIRNRMDFIIGLQIYGLIAVSAGLTSWLTIYRPAVKLLEEILEDSTVYSTWFGTILWILFSTVAFPWIVLLLLKNNNKSIIEEFAGTLAVKILEQEDEDE